MFLLNQPRENGILKSFCANVSHLYSCLCSLCCKRLVRSTDDDWLFPFTERRERVHTPVPSASIVSHLHPMRINGTAGYEVYSFKKKN
jgi:hypothetical protein